MYPNISIKNEKELCIIDIEGQIGVPEQWQFEEPDQRVATYEKFRQAVKSISDIQNSEIIVNIRSTGGDVNDALLIYEALSSTGADITTRCYGYTASAATIIAQAASEGKREIAQEALYLIHNSICSTEGNSEELEERVELLKKTDSRLAKLYATRANRSEEEFSALMSENGGRGRWLTAEEALKEALVDRIISKESRSTESSTPQALISRGWANLKRIISKESTHLPSDENNVLHFDLESMHSTRGAIVAQSRGQQSVEPTQVREVEDPTYRERALSANAEAYAHDAKRVTLR